jgi:protein TonB
MPTEITTRTSAIAIRNDPFGGGVAGSFLLHGAIAALLIGSAWYLHTGQNWGGASANTGTIQATMVSQIPLPPKQPTDQENVLATENPSPAPAPPAPKAVAVPPPDAIPIPVKPTKPAKVADKTAPPPPLHPQPATPQLNKATTGEAAASIPMSSVQTQAGTFSANIADAGFGARFAYYVQQITQKVAQQWYPQMLDPQAYRPSRLHHLPGRTRRLALAHPDRAAQRRQHSGPDRAQRRPAHRHLRPLARCLHRDPHQRHVLL